MAGSPARHWLCLAGLCAGVAYGFARASTAVAGVILVGACACLCARRRPLVTVTGLACLAFSLGALDAHARLGRSAALEAAAAGAPRCRFLVRALESEGGLGTLVAVERMDCESRRLGEHPGLVWVEEDAVPGAQLAGEGWLVPLGDDGFGDARRRFGAGAELVVISARARAPAGGLAGVAHDIRSGLSLATRGMQRERAGLLHGVTTGDTSLLGESVMDDFRSAGLAHLVAVSGQNVAMVLGAVAVVTRALAARARLIAGAAAVAMFVVVVGPQPSVLRAAAMAVIALAGLGFGSRAEPWHLFALALIAVVALRPAVLFSAGLHLSAAATAGLLLWARPLFRRLTRRGVPTLVSLSLAATLAAQLAVTPLVAGLFGSLSVAAPVANVLALPAVPPATVLGLCAAVAGALHPRAGAAVALAAEPFVAWILWVARVFGRAGWSALDVPSWTAWPLGAMVVALACVTAMASGRSTLGSLE